MVLELGPCPAEDLLRWSRFARRIVVELRTDTQYDGIVSPDVLELWSRMLDDWSATAKALMAEGRSTFRWTSELDPEVVEFQLDGLEKCLSSETVMRLVTTEEAEEQRAVTSTVVRALADALNAEGSSGRHLVDQVAPSLGSLLED